MENLSNILNQVFLGCLILTALKSMTIGSKFNFAQWIKYRGKYWEWYNKEIVDKEYKGE